MRVLLGIGNPGIRYQNTWHNVGFIFLDKLAEKHKLKFNTSKYDYLSAKGSVGDSEFLLIKPTTYVNNSGIAAKQIIERYNIEEHDLLVICDDINLPKGEIRIKKNGGDGGHNGLYSLIYHLNSREFPRIRFGIGNDFEKGDMADYVLSPISLEDFELIKQNFNLTIELANEFISGGVNSMLNYYSKNKNKINKEL